MDIGGDGGFIDSVLHLVFLVHLVLGFMLALPSSGGGLLVDWGSIWGDWIGGYLPDRECRSLLHFTWHQALLGNIQWQWHLAIDNSDTLEIPVSLDDALSQRAIAQENPWDGSATKSIVWISGLPTSGLAFIGKPCNGRSAAKSIATPPPKHNKHWVPSQIQNFHHGISLNSCSNNAGKDKE